MKKPHFNTGKRHAYRGMDGHLNIRCPLRAKSGWVRRSQAENLKLTAWVIKTLNAEIENEK